MSAVTEFGWCYRRPLKAPRICRWCGERMKLIRGRAIVCTICDETWWWDGGGKP